jgi:threonine dehydrogenase-like Zn-dependent dehydrogenase
MLEEESVATDEQALRVQPELANGEALVRVRYAGICGTDLHIFHGKHPRAKPPLVMGHEFCGYVARAGARLVQLLTPAVKGRPRACSNAIRSSRLRLGHIQCVPHLTNAQKCAEGSESSKKLLTNSGVVLFMEHHVNY